MADPVHSRSAGHIALEAIMNWIYLSLVAYLAACYSLLIYMLSQLLLGRSMRLLMATDDSAMIATLSQQTAASNTAPAPAHAASAPEHRKAA